LTTSAGMQNSRQSPTISPGLPAIRYLAARSSGTSTTTKVGLMRGRSRIRHVREPHPCVDAKRGDWLTITEPLAHDRLRVASPGIGPHLSSATVIGPQIGPQAASLTTKPCDFQGLPLAPPRGFEVTWGPHRSGKSRYLRANGAAQDRPRPHLRRVDCRAIVAPRGVEPMPASSFPRFGDCPETGGGMILPPAAARSTHCERDLPQAARQAEMHDCCPVCPSFGSLTPADE
jgi:hypothetical protein